MREEPTLNMVETQLSAFLDGELPGPEADLFVRRLERDAALQRSLARYALIGELMRTPASSGGHVASAGFAARVSAAIAEEPATVTHAEAGTARPRAPRWIRPAAGLSIAAAVALVAVGLVDRVAVDPGSATPAFVEAGGALEAEQFSYIVPEITVTGPLVPAARLTNYVMAHSEYSSPLGRRNVLSNMLADDVLPSDALIPAGFVPDDRSAQGGQP